MEKNYVQNFELKILSCRANFPRAKKLAGWMEGWMEGWKEGWKSRVKDCLQQSKIIF